MNTIFAVAIIPLAVFGINELGVNSTRATIDFSIAGICLITLILMRTKLPLKILPIGPVVLFGAYCIFLLYNGGMYLWVSIWLFTYPLISIFLCQIIVGVITSAIYIVGASVLLYSPNIAIIAYGMDPALKSRYIAGYLLIFALAITFEYVSILKDKKEEKLVAELARERDNLKTEIDNATGEIKNHLGKATEDGKQLNKVIVESSQALDVIKGNVEVTLTEAKTQSESVYLAVANIDKIVKSIDDLDESVIAQASHISSSSSSIEEMVANIASIRSVVGDISKTTEVLSNSSASGSAMMQKLTEEVEELHKRSEMLQEANKIIEDIAAKTNLLAMNAAIEAAHAGETGKGFAVVASEVRKLAESASKESKSISEEITRMGKTITSIAGVTKETVTSMGLIFNGIKTMDAAFAQVNNAVEEQAAGGSQILTALQSIKEETEKVRGGSEDIQTQSGSMSSEMHKLQVISGNVTQRINEVNEASKKIASYLDNAQKIVAT
jgi:methyl-accepting chemotaxis protein